MTSLVETKWKSYVQWKNIYFQLSYIPPFFKDSHVKLVKHTGLVSIERLKYSFVWGTHIAAVG